MSLHSKQKGKEPKVTTANPYYGHPDRLKTRRKRHGSGPVQKSTPFGRCVQDDKGNVVRRFT